MLSRLENEVLGNAMGLEALDGALTRATDALLKSKNKKRLIIDFFKSSICVLSRELC
jgi:hypothetical protein